MSKPNKPITKKSVVIGFASHNINYYVKDMSLSQALGISDSKITPIYYDPDIVNKQIFMKSKPIFDKRCFNVGKSIYNNNLYQLILLEFMTLFNQQRNESTRKQIKKKLLGNLNTDFDNIMEEVSTIVKDCDDHNKIKSQINEFINTHNSKNILFDEIDESFYNFDRELFEKIKKLPSEKLYNELLKISRKFIVFGNISSVKNFDFPNMFVSCQDKKKHKISYCKNNKLIVDPKKLKPILKIITEDILNPAKEKWLFSSVFGSNLISYFKFIRRPDETIFIDVI